MSRRLVKSKNKMLCGVCGGVAEFFNIDPTIIRIIMLVITIGGFGTGVLIYIAAAIIMPDMTVDNDYADGQDRRHWRDAADYDDRGRGNQSSEDEFNSYFRKDKK